MPFLRIGGRSSVAYRDTGPNTAPVVLLAHPLGMSQAVWDGLVARLCPRLRLISWDLPGHGASSAITRRPKASDLAAEALGLLDALGVARAHFLGTSIGGIIGQALLIDAPGRLDRLMLSNTGARIGQADAWHERAQRVRREGLPAMAAALVERWFGPVFAADCPEAVAGWQTQLSRSDDESYALLCEMLADTDFGGRLGGVNARVRLLAGAEDVATPVDVLRALAAELEDAEVTVFKGVGHVPGVEAPAATATFVDAALADGTRVPASFEQGLKTRRAVLGDGHVEHSLAERTALDAPFQDLITRMAWGELWGNPDLAHAERSMITIAVLAALGRDGELALHLQAARRIGLSQAQLRQTLTHVAVYAGVPAANHAFKLARTHGWGQDDPGDGP